MSDSLPNTGYLRLKEVLRFIPVSRSTWWNGIKTGLYPKPVSIGKRITAWHVEDIKKCIDNFQHQSKNNNGSVK